MFTCQIAWWWIPILIGDIYFLIDLCTVPVNIFGPISLGMCIYSAGTAGMLSDSVDTSPSCRADDTLCSGSIGRLVWFKIFKKDISLDPPSWSCAISWGSMILSIYICTYRYNILVDIMCQQPIWQWWQLMEWQLLFAGRVQDVSAAFL